MPIDKVLPSPTYKNHNNIELFKTTQNNPTYISTTLRDPARYFSGVVNVEVGPLVGALPSSLETRNLTRKVNKIPVYYTTFPATILTFEKKNLNSPT
jgi:DNA topoisomerase VI subunit B